MTDFIKGIVLGVFMFTVICILGAYSFYFTGMIVSLTAGFILGISPESIANIFAWIGIALGVYVFAKIMSESIKQAGKSSGE